jgi:sulfite reductase alpha subunit-like flavoprotein
MAFNKLGLATIHHMGSIAGAAGETRAIHTYLTNDDAAAVETSDYFLAMGYKFKVGDVIIASLDLDGTPTLRFYVVATASTSGVTITRETTAVTGDQTTIAALTDSSTGTADGTIADVGASFNQATLNNNFADVAAKINAIRTALVGSGLIASS